LNGQAPFKVCQKCRFSWQTVEQFVLESNLLVNGYKASFENPEQGVFMLTHICPQCRTTLSIPAGQFSSLYKGPEYTVLNFLNPECEGHCFREEDLRPCSVECSMRWVRDVLQYLRKHELPLECRVVTVAEESRQAV